LCAGSWRDVTWPDDWTAVTVVSLWCGRITTVNRIAIHEIYVFCCRMESALPSLSRHCLWQRLAMRYSPSELKWTENHILWHPKILMMDPTSDLKIEIVWLTQCSSCSVELGVAWWPGG